MDLSEFRIGDLITISDELNISGIKSFYGININKEFMPTVANTSGLNAAKYKIVIKRRFVYSGMQTGRDKSIRISMYTGENPIIVSPAYTTFEVTATDKIFPEFFFMIFLSKEKDRLGWFYSDGSVRANLDWSVFCNMKLLVPPLNVQKKYVGIYVAMQENQNNYECGIDDLKLVIDGKLDDLKKTDQYSRVGNVFEEIDERNSLGEYNEVMGINITKQFMPSDFIRKDLKKYKIVHVNDFAYSSMQTGRDNCIRIALLNSDNPVIVSPAYSVLRVKNDEVLPEYIMMWFSRAETDRYGAFLSDGSVRANLDLMRFYDIQIPIPSMTEQQALVTLYHAYQKRLEISERLKEELKNICPVLIRGAMEEAGA